MAQRKKPPEGSEDQGSQVSAQAPAPKAPPKAAAKTPAAKAADEDAAKRVAMARAAILRSTGKKIVGEDKSALPYVSTGSFLLDHLIGGTMAEDGKASICPGYPRRCYTEIYGAEASGKTTAALEAVADIQKQPGGIAMYLDFEKALNQKYARSIGVVFDPNKLMLFQPDTMEEGFKMLWAGLKMGVDLIVIDSVAAMVPKEELEKGFDDPQRIGAQARVLSIILPKLATWFNNPTISTNPKGTALIFINQIRALISTTSRNPDADNTPGGKALKYYAHLRVKFTRLRGEKVERKNKFTGKVQKYDFGQHTQAKIIKSRLDGSNGHTTDLFIRYGHGIDNYYSLIESGVATHIIKKSGSTLSYGGHDERSRDKFRSYLVNNPAIFEELKIKVVRAVKDDAPIEELDEDDELVESMDEAFEALTTEESSSEEVIETEDFVAEDQAAQDDTAAE